MRIGVGPREEQKKKKKKEKFQTKKAREKKKKRKKKRNKRGKEFSRCTSNQIVLTISSEIPPGNNGKSHWKGSLVLLLVNETLSKILDILPERARKMGAVERRKRRRRKKLDKNDRMWIIPPRLPTARGRRKRGEVEKEKEKEREREGGEETRNRKRRGEDVGEKWTMHVSQSGEEIRRRDPADA